MRVGESLARVVLANITLARGLELSSTKGDDDGVAGSRLGLNVIRLVVGIGASEGHAAGHRALSVRRVHLVDTGGVVRVDNGGDIKVSGASVAVEGELSEHTRSVGCAAVVGISVASPAIREGDVDRLASGDRGVLDGAGASPHDGTVGAIHGLERDSVGGADHRSQGGDSKVAELHGCCLYRFDFWNIGD